MKIGTVSNVNAFKGAQEVSATTSPNEKKDIKEVIKDNKGKIAIGLGALAAIGIATVAIATRKKIPSELSLDEFRKIGKFDKGAATVKGKPFSGVINVTNKKGKHVLEYADGTLKSSTKYVDSDAISKKVYTEKDGAKIIEKFSKTKTMGKTIITDNKIVREYKDDYGAGVTLQDVVEKQQDGTWKKTIQEFDFYSPDETFKNKNYSRYYINTKDEAGNVVAKKPVYLRESKSSGEPVLRQTKTIVDASGKEKYLTTKNGVPFAERQITVHDDGSKTIKVKYSSGTSKTINISADGTRTVKGRFSSI